MVMRRFVVTWDVDSHDPAMCGLLKRFVFGQRLRQGGREYRYPGFVEREGVRYLGQSVLFVVPARKAEIETFLGQHGIPHHILSGTLGTV